MPAILSPDQRGIDAALWRNVAVLAQHSVSQGYADGQAGVVRADD